MHWTESDNGDSNTLGGTIAYTIPGVQELTGETIDHFESLFDGDIQFRMQVSVENNDNGNMLECTSSTACDIVYRYLYTPQLFDVIPNHAWAGAKVNFMINPAAARNQIEADDPPYEYIKVGNEKVDYTGLMETTYRTGHYRVSPYPAYLGAETKVSLNSPPTIEFYVGLTKVR